MTQKNAEREQRIKVRRNALLTLGLELDPKISQETQDTLLAGGIIYPDMLKLRSLVSASAPNSATQPEPTRCAILREASEATAGDRNRAYGNPAINLSCAQELYEVYRRYAKTKSPLESLGAAHEQAISQICTKLGRIATGGEYRRDNYVDGACYFAIAGEVAVRPMSGDVSLEAAKASARHGS